MNGSGGEVSFEEVSALNRIPINDALDALAQPQRRKVLFALLSPERDPDSPIHTTESPDGTETSLRPGEMNTAHLSKLADHGFIDWNPETNVIEKGGKFDDIKPLLELLADHEDELPDGRL